MSSTNSAESTIVLPSQNNNNNNNNNDRAKAFQQAREFAFGQLNPQSETVRSMAEGAEVSGAAGARVTDMTAGMLGGIADKKNSVSPIATNVMSDRGERNYDLSNLSQPIQPIQPIQAIQAIQPILSIGAFEDMHTIQHFEPREQLLPIQAIQPIQSIQPILLPIQPIQNSNQPYFLRMSSGLGSIL